jgi:hypothetical protein
MNNETVTEDICKKPVSVSKPLEPSIQVDKNDDNGEADHDMII